MSNAPSPSVHSLGSTAFNPGAPSGVPDFGPDGRLYVVAKRRHGAEVETAPDGRAGLERLTRLPTVDLVLCDVIMPGMGGPELFRHLVERDLAVPFLFTSGYPDRWNLEEFEGLGRIGFLPKPFDLATLARRVGELLL